MIRASYQKRLSALILGLRPTASHIYGVDIRFAVDNLSANGLVAWGAGLGMLRDSFADPSVHLTPTEEWIAAWVETETERERHRWQDASTMLELLALSLGPMSLDPSHLRPDWFWSMWFLNLHEHRAGLDAGRTSLSGDTLDLARHCLDLARAHSAPDGMIELLADIERTTRPVHHQPEVFRPMTTPGERLQLSAMIASAYSIADTGCVAAEERLLEQRPALVTVCSRQSRRHSPF